MIKEYFLLLVLLFLPSPSSATKCMVDDPKLIGELTPIILKVKILESNQLKFNSLKQDEKYVIKAEVTQTYKGNVTDRYLLIKYPWSNSSRSKKQFFEVGKEYIVLVESLTEGEAKIVSSFNCSMPNQTFLQKVVDKLPK